MLTRLSVSNYRCLAEFELLPCRKQLLLGRNGTGKSTLFDVLALLRDFCVLGQQCDGRLAGRTRTRWSNLPDQAFELDVSGNGGAYRYRLVIDESGSPLRARVKSESLVYDDRPLFGFQDGEISLYNDQQAKQPNVRFRCDWHRSGLAIVDARPDNTKLTWFKQFLGNLVQVQINPWGISARSERESKNLDRDAANFADWYRHLRLDRGNQVHAALQCLKEVIPDFEALDLRDAGLETRILQVTFRVNHKSIEIPFTEISDGQRVLIVLYMVLHCAVSPESTLLIDEPDSFLALAEIQPWLMQLNDRIDDQVAQVILISHHPEILNQWAASGGLVLDRTDGDGATVRSFPDNAGLGLPPAEIIARGWEGV